jgi:hypothetical protein
MAPVASLGPALLATIVYVTDSPGMAIVVLSVLVIERSAAGTNVSVSVAALSDVSGSPPVETEAVLTSEPVADGDSVQFAVYVTFPPNGRFTASPMFPEPLAVHVPPLRPAQAHVQVSDAGNASVTVAPMASLGPALLATIVYVSDPPGVAEVAPSVFVIERSASAVNVSVSVAELLDVFGSLNAAPGIIAVLTSEPVADGETAQLAV